MEKIKLILDCDPGHDDAVAILMAGGHPAIDLLAITVVSGNQTLEKTAINAMNVCQYLGLDIPVYAGCSEPMVRKKITAGDIHGKTGLDGPKFEPLNRTLGEEHAVTFLTRKLMESEGDITLVTTGPMTNVGMAMRMEPRIIHAYAGGKARRTDYRYRVYHRNMSWRADEGCTVNSYLCAEHSA